MILEELIGCLVALVSRLFVQTPPISVETLQRDYTLIPEENPEQEEEYYGLIHCEYEEGAEPKLPYYEEDIPALVQANEQPRPRSFCESFLRSCEANIGLVLVSILIGIITIGIVYLDLNTAGACIEWMNNKLVPPAHIRTLQIIGTCIKLLPLFTWFSASVIMLWGFREFKSNYLLCLFICQFLTGSIACVYRIIMFDKIVIEYNEYRLPGHSIFILSVLSGAYLVARKFKKVNPATSYSVFRIIFILSFTILSSCLLALIYTYVIVKYFRESKDKVQKAIIAALTPGLIFPLTAIAKYIALRKTSEIIKPDRAFALCFFLRGCTTVLYRTMQSGFQRIWLFIGLSLLHGVVNVLSKATLNIRINIWKSFIKCYNRTCCGPRLEVQTLNSPRIRRLNADLEIQNILFEYTTVILSQAYLACYLVMSFDIPPWQVMRGSLIRIALSLAIDFMFNIISVFIQIHIYDIPMKKVWLKYWLRHMTINAFMIICTISYFSGSLVSVFACNQYTWKDYKLRNCTSIF